MLSSRFADIFRGNSLKGGLLTVLLDQEVIDRIWAAVEADPTIEVTVDLVEREVRVPAADVKESFDLDDYTRWRLLEGLDDIALTLRHTDDISAFETTRESWKPVTILS